MFGMSHRMADRLDCCENSNWAVIYSNVAVLAAFHSMSARRLTPKRRAMPIQLASLRAFSVWPFLMALYTEVLMPREAACFASLG